MYIVLYTYRSKISSLSALIYSDRHCRSLSEVVPVDLSRTRIESTVSAIDLVKTLDRTCHSCHLISEEALHLCTEYALIKPRNARAFED